MGDEKQATTADSQTTTCRVCQEPIRDKAVKCIKCGSYQDWTRYVLRWSAFLGSLFVLTQLWSIADSLSSLAFTDKAARVEAAITSCRQDEVRVAYENSGELSGIVTGVDYSLRIDGVESSPDLDVRNRLSDEDVLVSPKAPPVRASYRAYIDNTPASFIAESMAERDCAYLIDIRWIDFSGTEQLLSKECRCP